MNDDLTNAIAEAKRRMPLPELLRHYRVDGNALRGINSPLRPGSDSGCFRIFQKPGGDWNWKDHVSGEFGDEIDFIEGFEKRSKEDAITKFLEMAGVARSGPSPSGPIPHQVSGPPVGDALPAPRPKLRRRHEAEREPDAPSFDWAACVEAAKSQLAQVAEWRGISLEFLEAIRAHGLMGSHAGHVAFPVKDEAGNVVSCHYRVPDGSWRYFPRPDHVSPLVIGDPQSAQDVMIFESQWDALAVADKLGWHTWHEDGKKNVAFIITRGASNGKLVAGLIGPDARVIAWPQNDPPKKTGLSPAEQWFADVAEATKGIALHRAEIPKEHKDANDWVKAGADKTVLRDTIADARDPKLAVLLDREFDFNNPPPKTVPVLWLGDVGVAKPCDLVAVSAQVKAGKSSVIGAMMACLISSEGDFLGFRGDNRQRATILHVDTEQSPEDHHNLIMRTLYRGRCAASPPPYLRSFCFTNLSVPQRKDALRYALEVLPRPFATVLIDGVADLCHDVNDPEEANALVDTLYKWAIEYYVPIICVLHENPGTTTGKTRGHLGSQLERKAATNLRLEKSADGRIEIFTEKARRGHVGKGSGPCFEWSDEASMHVSCERDDEDRTSGRFTQKYQTDDILKQMSAITPMKTRELLRVCSEETGISKPNFYRLWGKIKSEGLVKISDEGWLRK